MLYTTALLAGAALLNTVTAEASPRVVGFEIYKDAKAEPIQRRSGSFTSDIQNLQHQDGFGFYLINVTVGTPPQAIGLQLDTGSSDIWFTASKSAGCQKTPDLCAAFGTFDATKSSTFVEYAAGLFSISYVDGSKIVGDYINDTFTLGNVQVKDMTMGLATSGSRVYGIMGIGSDLDESITHGGSVPSNAYPSIIDQLYLQGFTASPAFSLWLNDRDSNSGNILFGGVDTSRYTGPLTVLPIQADQVNGIISTYTVALNSVSFTNKDGAVQYSAKNQAIPVVLDSGTTYTILQDDIVNAINAGVGATTIDRAGDLVVPCSIGDSGAVLTFGFGGTTEIKVPIKEFVLQIPTKNNNGQPVTFPDGTLACTWGLQAANGRPNLFGDTFLRSAYVVYDLSSAQIGIAATNFNPGTQMCRKSSVVSSPALQRLLCKQRCRLLLQPISKAQTPLLLRPRLPARPPSREHLPLVWARSRPLLLVAVVVLPARLRPRGLLFQRLCNGVRRWERQRWLLCRCYKCTRD
jgi:hypothetical protein